MNVTVHSPSNDEWFGLLAMIDSGTQENWISQTIVIEYSLRAEGGMPIRGTGFGGGYIKSDRCVKLTWRKERAKKTERAYFHVGKDAPFDVLFGSNIVRAAPHLFEDDTLEPTLVLIQNKVSVRQLFGYLPSCANSKFNRVLRRKLLSRTGLSIAHDLKP